MQYICTSQMPYNFAGEVNAPPTPRDNKNKIKQKRKNKMKNKRKK